MKTALVCGAGGFIGSHLVTRLKAEGYYVRAIDRKQPEFGPSDADDFYTFDLRKLTAHDPLFTGGDRMMPPRSLGGFFDEVYQLACEVGGLGYIMDRGNDAVMLHNSAMINLQVLESCRRLRHKPKLFFASSACVYPSLSARQNLCSQACREDSVPPANPDNEYAWEKIFSERLYAAYARNYAIPVCIARFHNCFGPLGTWKGGREKAPAAICRKVAQAANNGLIDIWGDGTQTRSFMYVDDAVEGILRLMRSDFQGPVNIGSSEMVTVDHLVDMVCEIAGKTLTKNHVAGPVGVQGRNSDQTLIRETLGWEPSIPLRVGLEKTYKWIEEQVRCS